jgi:hypothetical protein
MQKCIAELPAFASVSEDQQRILNTVSAVCRELRATHRLLAVPTDNALAAKYAICPRTVRNWRRAGCPFAKGQRRVLAWLAARRYAPAGAQAKFHYQLRNRRWKAEHRDFMAELRGLVLEERAECRARGLKQPDWTRRMPFRAR